MACGVVLVLLLGSGTTRARPVPGWIAKVKDSVGRWQERRQVKQRLRKIDPLLVKAYEARKDAHAPYSHCRVGAAVLVKRGGLLGSVPGLRRRVVKGFNSESHGDLQLCAERTATASLPRGRAASSPVLKVAVLGGQNVPTPCGRCLQVISELGTPETKVISANLAGEHRSFRLRELVPNDFHAASSATLQPYRPLIARAVRAYRACRTSEINRYRPAFGTAVQTDRGEVHAGMVLKDTAATFTPATQLPLNLVSQRNAQGSRRQDVRTVVIAGVGQGDGAARLPLPTADERQHIVDMNPKARVVLYNPSTRAGAVIRASDLLPQAYERKK